MKVYRTYDTEAVDAILKDESVFRDIIDDSSPSIEKFTAKSIVSDLSNVALIVSENGKAIGCFICVPCSDTTYEGHINLTDECRGDKALEALNLGAEWLFLNTNALRIVGMTPESNKPALTITRLAGYQRIARRSRVVSRAGKLEDMIQSELSLYRWLSSQKVKSKINFGLDEWHLQYLFIAKKLIESGLVDKAKLLLGEVSNHSYAKRINIDGYPQIKVGTKIFNIKKVF